MLSLTRTVHEPSMAAGEGGREARPCVHCGTPFTGGNREERFCCAGCHYVWDLIHEGGLERYYELKGDTAAAPVKSIVFQSRDYEWLHEAAAKADGCVDLEIQGISCIGCVWLIESIFAGFPGGLRIEINAHLGRIRLWWKPEEFDLGAFAIELQRFGYILGAVGERKSPRYGSRELVVRIGLCAAFAMNGMGFTLPRYLGMDPTFELARIFELIALLSATLSLFVGGSYFIHRAWQGLKLRLLHMDLPISLGVLMAYGGSLAGWLLGVERLLYFDFVSVFIFLMLSGRWVQEVAVERNRHRLLTGQPGPGKVRRFGGEGGREEKVELEALESGDDIGIGPGEVVPVGGELLSEAAELSLEWINGEPEARVWKRGGRVPAGAVNLGAGTVRVRAAEGYRDSAFARLLDIGGRDEEAGIGAANEGLQRLLKVYLGAILIVGTVGGVAWAVFSREPGTALQVAISVFVVSCPCALGVALPLADELSVRAMRSFGLFVRGNSLWRKLARIGCIAFDKTGTLTTELPQLLNGEELERLGERERTVLAELVRESRHPFSRSLREAIVNRWGDPSEKTGEELADVVEVVGQGIEGVDPRGVSWKLGRDDRRQAGDCVFTRDGRLCARFHFEEALRPDAVAEIADLKRRGLEVFILSGDRDEKVRPVGEALDLPSENCLGKLKPEDKASWMSRRAGCLFIGDGANDSLAFRESDCSGTPAVDSAVLQQQADFFYLGSGLRAIRTLFEVAGRRRRAVRVVFGFSLAYNLAAVGICLAGWMSPLLAAVLMPASSLLSLSLVASHFRGVRWREVPS